MRVHFICRGNAYRSLLAEAYFKTRSTIPVTSSGVVADIYREYNKSVIVKTRKFLESKKLPPALAKAPIQLTDERLHKDDTLVCVNKEAEKDLLRLFRPLSKPIVWDIADYDEPEGGQAAGLSREEYTKIIYKKMTQKVDKLIEQLENREV